MHFWDFHIIGVLVTVFSTAEKADYSLFTSITNPTHCLYQLLPPTRSRLSTCSSVTEDIHIHCQGDLCFFLCFVCITVDITVDIVSFFTNSCMCLLFIIKRLIWFNLTANCVASICLKDKLTFVDSTVKIFVIVVHVLSTRKSINLQ